MTDVDLRTALALVAEGAAAAVAKHGNRCILNGNHDRRLRIMTEEVGEIAQAIDDYELAGSDEEHATASRSIRDEIRDVAACAVLWLADELTSGGSFFERRLQLGSMYASHVQMDKRQLAESVLVLAQAEPAETPLMVTARRLAAIVLHEECA